MPYTIVNSWRIRTETVHTPQEILMESLQTVELLDFLRFTRFCRLSQTVVNRGEPSLDP